MRFETVDVTPTLAKTILNANTNNRPVTPDRVARFATDMRSGKWQHNGETVIISLSGRLLDGQHRLAAVVEADVPVRMAVAYDAPDDAFTTIDTGSSRSAGDITALSISGLVGAPSIAAAAASLIYRMVHGLPLAGGLTPRDTAETVKRYPGISKWTSKCNGRGRSLVLSPGILVAALTYLDDIAGKPELADKFYIGMVSGADLASNSPILALRNRVANLRAQGIHIKADIVWGAVVRALSALEAGEPLQRVHATRMNGAVLRPDLFDIHMQSVPVSQRLADLPPTERVSVANRKRIRATAKPF